MKTKNILVRGAQVITFLFAGFGNFLLNVAPPVEGDPSFAVAVSSILTLFALLFISATTKNYNQKFLKKIWLGASLLFFVTALISSIIYKDNLNTLTFSYPPENPLAQHIAGTVFTPVAEKYRQENPQKTLAETVAAFGGLASLERVWTRDSIVHAKKVLTVNYILVVLSVAFMLFSLTEGVLVSPKDYPEGLASSPKPEEVTASTYLRPGTVFLSYASEDRPAVQSIKEALEAAGVEVFFDKTALQAGENWDAKLKRSISESSLFIPVISKNTITRERRYFRLEWNSAIEEAKKASLSQTFIIPVVIDKTSPNEEGLPEEFSSPQWEVLPGGQPSAAFVERIKQLYRDYLKLKGLGQ